MIFKWAGALFVVFAPGIYGHAPNLVLTPQQMQFQASSGAPNPAWQLLTITNSTHGDMEWISNITATGNWLAISQRSGMLPGLSDDESMNVYIGASAVALKPGVYTGTITITASRLYFGVVYQATNSPQSITVTLTVAQDDSPSVKVSTNSLTLQGVSGGSVPSSAQVFISNAGTGTLTWTSRAQTTDSANWLAVTPASGGNSGTITVTANPSNLNPGTYTGRVNVSAPGSPAASILITYVLRAPTPPQLQLTTQPLNFFAVANSVAPPSQAISIANGGEKALNWQVTSSTFNGGSWLSVTPASGTSNGNINVSASPGSLPAGIYAGRIVVTADGAVNSPMQVQVNLTVKRQSPSLTGGGFFQAADFSREGLVAGGLASIFGERLGPRSAVLFSQAAASTKLPVDLAGTRVTIDGTPSPLFFVSYNQINLQIPFEVAGKTSVVAKIEANGFDPAEFPVTLRPVGIGLFTVDLTRAAALNQDGTLNTGDNPAAPGSIVQFYATAQGPLENPVSTGAIAPTQPPFPSPMTPVTVRVGGIPSRILYSGLAPGLVGTAQLNVQLPADIKPGYVVPVEVQMGDWKASVVYISIGAAASSTSP